LFPYTTLFRSPGEQRLGAAQVLGRGDAVREGPRFVRDSADSRLGPLRSAGRPAADADAQDEDRGDPQAPVEPAVLDQHVLPPPCARRYDPPPHLFARRLGRTVIVLSRVPQQPFEPVSSHDTHSPAKSASASRSFPRARDSCAFDVPVSMPRAAPISSWV